MELLCKEFFDISYTKRKEKHALSHMLLFSFGLNHSHLLIKKISSGSIAGLVNITHLDSTFTTSYHLVFRFIVRGLKWMLPAGLFSVSSQERINTFSLVFLLCADFLSELTRFLSTKIHAFFARLPRFSRKFNKLSFFSRAACLKFIMYTFAFLSIGLISSIVGIQP